MTQSERKTESRPLRIVIISKNDSRGGAAVVSMRLMEALRDLGMDARMLVAEKSSDSPFVEKASSELLIKEKFIFERMSIFRANGFNRKTLFQIDTGQEGLPLHKHPLVKQADAILLGWVNQGFLSLKGVSQLCRLGKPVIWTMHDMWCFTGICHHADTCLRYEQSCGDCPILGNRGYKNDISHKTWLRKNNLYSKWCGPKGNLRFVAVSNWLKEKSLKSSLFSNITPAVIGNPFLVTKQEDKKVPTNGSKEEIKIAFGAARLDDPIKGFPYLIEMTKVLKKNYPDLAENLRLITFGDIRDTSLFERIDIPHTHLGRLNSKEEIYDVYKKSLVTVSSSLYETFSCVLEEAQAFGSIPVSFDRGGQNDIVTHLSTGYLAKFSDNYQEGGRNLAEGIVWACQLTDNSSAHSDIRGKMRRNIVEKFDSLVVAEKYMELIRKTPSHG